MQAPTESDRPAPQSPVATKPVQPSSPRLFFSPTAAAAAGSLPGGGAHRRIAIAVDLSDESAYAVKWSVQNYLRPGDAVILLHVRPTSVLYGADWGAIDLSVAAAAAAGGDGSSEESQRKLEDDFDAFTSTKLQDLAQPLVEAQIPFRIHIVKDHDMKERLCLEIERLGLSAVIMGSRGFGAAPQGQQGRLGSVSDYCVHHCVCPVVVVRDPDDKDGLAPSADGREAEAVLREVVAELREVPEEEEEPEYHDASDEKKENDKESPLKENHRKRFCLKKQPEAVMYIAGKFLIHWINKCMLCASKDMNFAIEHIFKFNA